MKKNEMGGANDTFGGEESCVEGFGGENLKERSTWKT
jgi:hypothetical protein